MDIRMYDCGFGDCFRLESGFENKNPLYVDFGIRSGVTPKETRFEEIVSDMPQDKDFLLTHYHDDHYAGAIYAMGKTKFNNIYIPDIWNINIEVSIAVIRSFLLRDLLNRMPLEKNVSLFDFLDKLCSSAAKVHFIKAGNDLQGIYNVLWPQKEYIVPFPETKLEKFKIKTLDIFGELNDIATNLRKAFLNRDSKEIMEQKRKYQEILPNFADMESHDKSKLKKELEKWGNKVSVVFHSKRIIERNVLFCGDVPNELWPYIRNNIRDDTDKIEGEYDVIKIPHHGTKSCYVDFTHYSKHDTVFLIPNRIFSDRSTSKIDKRYSLDANYCGCVVRCSGNNCEAYKENERCVCTNYCVISNTGDFYSDIR